jgi:PAS domain S-box-containing protein
MIRTEITETKTMTKTRILLVDDEPDFTKLTTLALKKIGYAVTTAVDGQEALDFTRDNKPDLVLMDIVLKGQIDGVEAAEQIRSRFNIPVVYLTGHTDDTTLARAKITEPFGYVVKPFEYRELKIAIEIAIYKAKMESKLKALAEKLRESTASFHNIVEKNADGIIVVDSNGIVRFVNHAAEILFGHRAEELLGETFGFPVVTSEMMEINITRSGGEKGVGEMHIVEIQWGSKTAYLVSIRDITDHKKTEEALRKSERKYRSLVESIPDVTWTTDCEGNTTFISPSVEKVYGYNPEEIYKAGYSIWFGRIHPDDVEKVKEAYRTLFKKRTQFDIEYRIKRKDKQWIWLHDRSIVTYEKDGFLYADGIFSDITERKKAERELRETSQYLENLLNYANAPIIVWDPQFKITRFNHAFEALTGRSAHDVIGKSINILFPTDKVDSSMEFIREAIEGKRWETVEIGILHLDGAVRTVLWNSATLFDSDGMTPVATIAQGQDITERKQKEAELKILNEELKTTVDKLALTNHELQDFVRAASHDLKAPLGAITKLAEWISTDCADKLSEDGRGQMNLLLGRVARMHNLIDSILEYSRVGREREEQIQVDLNELVPKIIHIVAPPENIEIAVENELPVVKCRQTQITKVFQNLLSNAVMYMDKPQGKVRIGCIEENGFWKFSIADNGPGIEERHFERVFEFFKTLQPRDTFESTGIGLAVAKKIVELYGGQIWVESESAKGSTFFFTLPKQQVGVTSAKLEANIAC